MAVKKVSISLTPESLAQLDFLREKLRLNPKIKLSSLIQQVIFDEYSRLQSSRHGFSDCSEDCEHCPDEPICDYSRAIDRYMV